MNKKQIRLLIEDRIQEYRYQQTVRKIADKNNLFKNNNYIDETIINELTDLSKQIEKLDTTEDTLSSINRDNKQYTTEEVIAILHKDKTKSFKRVNDENFIIYRGNYGDIMMKIKDIVIRPLPIFNYYQDLWLENINKGEK